MLAKPVRRDEQIKLIMECRQSGMSDYEWCKEHNINPGTFYNWISRLKRTENLVFPQNVCSNRPILPKQEVVKVDLADTPTSVISVNDEYNTRIANVASHDSHNVHVMQIHFASGSVDVPNGTDPLLLETTLRILGGSYAR